MNGNGIALGLSGRRRLMLAVEGDEDDVVVNGPESKWQPEQPAAAEPTKVGEYVPKLDDLTEPALGALKPETAPADPTVPRRYSPGTNNSSRNGTRLRKTCRNTPSPLLT
jgi:hypothetical protein